MTDDKYEALLLIVLAQLGWYWCNGATEADCMAAVRERVASVAGRTLAEHVGRIPSRADVADRAAVAVAVDILAGELGDGERTSLLRVAESRQWRRRAVVHGIFLRSGTVREESGEAMRGRMSRFAPEFARLGPDELMVARKREDCLRGLAELSMQANAFGDNGRNVADVELEYRQGLDRYNASAHSGES